MVELRAETLDELVEAALSQQFVEPGVERMPRTGRHLSRRYWLIFACNARTDEVKYFVSNAPANAKIEDILRAGMARWHVEKWFERAKQLAGFGEFEVRKYVGLIRHWLCSRIAMYFLAVQTKRLRGKPADNVRAGDGGLSAAAGEDHQLLAEIMA